MNSFGTSLEHFEKNWMGQGVKCMNKTLYEWYKGEYKDGKFHGQGTFYYPSGKIYKGKQKDGKKQGKGTLTFTNGDKYVVTWKDNKINGQGTYTYGKGEWEGDKYEGEWMNERWHGQGKYIFSNGGKIVGKFRGGKDWSTKEYDKEGNITRKLVNGKGQ